MCDVMPLFGSVLWRNTHRETRREEMGNGSGRSITLAERAIYSKEQIKFEGLWKTSSMMWASNSSAILVLTPPTSVNPFSDCPLSPRRSRGAFSGERCVNVTRTFG